MTADTRLIFISPEDDAKIKPVLFTYARSTPVCLLIWFQHHLLSASRSCLHPGNSEATPSSWRRLAVVLFIPSAGAI